MALTLLSLEVAAFKRNHVTNLNTKCHFGACSVSAGRVDMVSAQREVWHTDPFEVLAHNGAIYVRGTTCERCNSNVACLKNIDNFAQAMERVISQLFLS